MDPVCFRALTDWLRRPRLGVSAGLRDLHRMGRRVQHGKGQARHNGRRLWPVSVNRPLSVIWPAGPDTCPQVVS